MPPNILRLKTLANHIVFVVCWVLMAACLAFEGFILAFEGFPYYEHLLPLTLVVGIAWTLTALSCFFYRRSPILSVVGGGTILLVNSISLWRSEPETHELDWFLYMHSVELLFIVVSCTGAFIKSRFRPSHV